MALDGIKCIPSIQKQAIRYEYIDLMIILNQHLAKVLAKSHFTNENIYDGLKSLKDLLYIVQSFYEKRYPSRNKTTKKQFY